MSLKKILTPNFLMVVLEMGKKKLIHLESFRLHFDEWSKQEGVKSVLSILFNITISFMYRTLWFWRCPDQY